MFFKALSKLDETAAGSVCASAACAAQARLLSRGSRGSRGAPTPHSAPRAVPEARPASRRCCGLLRTCGTSTGWPQALRTFPSCTRRGSVFGVTLSILGIITVGRPRSYKLKGRWRKRSPRLRRTPNTLNYWLVFRDLPGWPPHHRVPFLLHTRSRHTRSLKVAGFPVSARQFYFAPRLAMPHGLLTCQLLCCSWPIWT